MGLCNNILMERLITQGVSEADLSGNALRSYQARALADIVKGSEDKALDPAYVPDFTPDTRFDDAYGRLGERLYVDYAQKGDATGNEALRELAKRAINLHGCYVLTRLMRYGPEAYADYSKDQPFHQPSILELAGIMQRSSAVHKTFADLNKKDNTTAETAFGLLTFAPQYEDIAPFQITPDAQGGLVFDASPVLLRRAKIEALQKRLAEGLPIGGEPGEKCPAIGMVLDGLWSKGVELCATDPQLYAADLAEHFPDRSIAA